MKRNRIQVGFTLLEMLTALAIIAVMIGLLIPAISKIQDTAHTVKQKAQFGAIEIALEAFNADTGDYPQSSYTSFSGNPADGYCGAQKLAEAIVGMDGFGFHPKSQWRSDGMADFDGDGTFELIYDVVNGVKSGAVTLQTPNDNLKARKGPYLELEKANAVKVNSLYNANPDININTFVLADMFGNVKNKATGKKTGMPILYFRADTGKTLHYPTPMPTLIIHTPNSIYNPMDNGAIFSNKAPWDTSMSHPMWTTGVKIFYDRIRNPNFTAPDRPYRATSFILLSAGSDGVYGSADDVYNIDENEK